MNNEPVAWIDEINTFVLDKDYQQFPKSLQHGMIPLYTHPVKELKNIVVASATCSCGKVMEVTNLQPVKELTTELDQLLSSVNGDYYLGKDKEEELVKIVRKQYTKPVKELTQNIAEIKRTSDQSITISFASCRSASEFEAILRKAQEK